MSDGGGDGRDLAFVSYSHADQVWLERLQIWLKPYVHEGQLRIWADPYIRTGDLWRRDIAGALARSRVGVLLVSQHLAASDFIHEVELPALRDASRRGLLKLFPIPVTLVGKRHVAILGLDDVQWARAPEQPLDALGEAACNQAMVEIVDKLLDLFASAGMERGEGALAPSTRGLPGPPPLEARRSVAALAPLPSGQPGVLHGVPPLPPHFVPRASALAALERALLEGREQRHGISAVAKTGVHGQGGIGKTVLATALARDDDVRRAFADGVFWLTVGQEPDLAALQRLLFEMVTGRREEFVSTNLGEVALREALRDKSCLLILDDVWHGAHAAAFDVLGERGRLLVTTRDAGILRALGARAENVDVLAPGDAKRLIAEWAGVDAEALPVEADGVAEQCGYVPLALSLAGAQVAGGTPWTELLAALRAGDLEFLDHAHRSVFKSLSLSVRALAPADADRCRELAVFPEDTAVPEGVVLRLWGESGLTREQAGRLLRSFADKALLSLAGDAPDRTVRLHDLQGDYLRLVARDLATAHAHLLAAHLRLGSVGEKGPARWASLPAGETYLWRHLFHHLLGAGRSATADALVTSVTWLRAKIAASGVSALLADLAFLADRAPSDENRRIEHALRLEAAWLHGDPGALEGVLYNRLRSAGATAGEIERLTPGLHPRIRLGHPVNLGGERVFRGHSGTVSACAYSSDGTRILSVSSDRTVREWDRSTGQELRRFEGHSGSVSACAYSPDGARILSASDDRTLCEWDRSSGQELRRFEGHSSLVIACAYSPDGTRILSASFDGTVREWDRSSGQELRRFEGHSRVVRACAYAPDGTRILSASEDRTVREWDRSSGQEILRFEGHSGWVFACAYSSDGTRILSASGDRTLREWGRSSDQELRHFEGHAGRVTACAYSPNGNRILSASGDETVREWDRSSGQELRRFEGHSDWVWACAYSPDGTRILSASDDRIVCEWDRSSGQELRRFEGHSDWVRACAYSPDGTRILSASYDETLREWDRSSGRELRRFEGHSDWIWACAYSPDGRCILSASGDGTVREWDRSSGEELGRFEGHLDGVSVCAYSPDGTRILSASDDSTLFEWDRSSGQEVRRFAGHSGRVWACAYSPGGTRILSASDDSTVKIWSSDGRCLDTLYGAAPFTCVAVTRGHFAAGDVLGNLWMLDCDWL
jgi:WD40 repeat protein